MSPVLVRRAIGLAGAAVLIAFSALFVLANPVGAETLEVSPTVIDVPPGAAVQLSPVVLAIIGGTIVPILAGIVSRTTAASGAVALVNLFFSAALTAANYLLTNPVFDVATVVILFSTTFVSGIASYYGFWKPIGKGTAGDASRTAGGDRSPLNGVLGIIGPKPEDPPAEPPALPNAA